jgi:hypothetical protein
MAARELPLDTLIKLAAAGGGFSLSATGTPVEDLIRIAAAGQAGNAQLTFIVSEALSDKDLIRIAAAGAGSVIFQNLGGTHFAVALSDIRSRLAAAL